jgi:hypothetical protein
LAALAGWTIPSGDARHAIKDEAFEKIDIQSRPIKYEQIRKNASCSIYVPRGYVDGD